jgi:Ca-activated chloride channel family protein
MKYYSILPTLCFILAAIGVNGQNVKGHVSTTDTADLTILNVFPDSFPNVSVIFKAETRKGEPVWNLSKDKMLVKENEDIGKVVSLEPISKNKALNLGIVIDHSGSMSMDFSKLYDKAGNPTYSFDAYGNMVYPKGYTAPIDNAKSAVKHFVKGFNFQKDLISIIGFSATVDKRLSLTQDLKRIDTTINGMQADFSTAFYDAMIAGLDEVKKGEGLKVLIALTDGQDNSSKSGWRDVVEHANSLDIPIYVIGLGDVQKDTLQQISKLTKGSFFFTESSNSLDEVYSRIRKQVQAFYELVYESPNISSADSTRKIQLSFDADSLYLVTNAAESKFPVEVLTLLEKKQKQREYILYAGGIGTVALISAGSLLIYFRRRKLSAKRGTIRKLFPNPTKGKLTIEYEGPAGQLSITDVRGNTVRNINLEEGESELDFSDLGNGIYVATATSEGQVSNAMKFIIAH